MADPGGQPPLEGSPIWWEEMTLASRCVAFSGKAVYQPVAALGAAEGRDLSPDPLARAINEQRHEEAALCPDCN
jgi:hypothetical protein